MEIIHTTIKLGMLTLTKIIITIEETTITLTVKIVLKMEIPLVMEIKGYRYVIIVVTF